MLFTNGCTHHRSFSSDDHKSLLSVQLHLNLYCPNGETVYSILYKHGALLSCTMAVWHYWITVISPHIFKQVWLNLTWISCLIFISIHKTVFLELLSRSETPHLKRPRSTIFPIYFIINLPCLVVVPTAAVQTGGCGPPQSVVGLEGTRRWSALT